MGKCSESHCLSHVLHVHITCRCVLKDKLNVPLSTLHDLMSCYRLTRHLLQIELDLYRTLPTHKRYKADGEWVCFSIICVSYYHSCVVLSKKYYIMHCCVSNYRLICVYTYIHDFGMSHNSKT